MGNERDPGHDDQHDRSAEPGTESDAGDEHPDAAKTRAGSNVPGAGRDRDDDEG